MQNALASDSLECRALSKHFYFTHTVTHGVSTHSKDLSRNNWNHSLQPWSLNLFLSRTCFSLSFNLSSLPKTQSNHFPFSLLPFSTLSDTTHYKVEDIFTKLKDNSLCSLFFSHSFLLLMEVMLMKPLLALLFISFFINLSVEVSATTIALYNKCPHPVWPGIQPSAGRPILAKGGFKLNPKQAYSLRVPAEWSGRIWGRRDCVFDAAGKGHCATGDCGGSLYCNGLGGEPPATLAEITLGAQDFYDVSLVDGYNLAISITPFKGKGRCSYAGCVSDLNEMCPVGLQVKGHNNAVVACKSACFAFKSPKYCCTGLYGNPQSCKPTAYSRIFKTACPRAYSYAYDDPTSIATCSGASYLVTYCPHH